MRKRIFSTIAATTLLSCIFPASVGSTPLEKTPEYEGMLDVSKPAEFIVEERLKKNVDFWIHCYTQYYTYQGLIHDSKYIDLIYEVVDLRTLPLPAHKAPHNTRPVKRLKEKWKKILLSVHKKQNSPDEMTEDEKRVFQLFSTINEPNKFLNAAHRKRLRFQLGQRDQFVDGLAQSGRYLPVMEEIFRREGLPRELTRLPFVESSFNVRARSKVGASGIWQFMRSTGKFFLRINDAVDERNDPVRATEAAAKLLSLNYESLRRWPLAVTAYNHGRKGMMRAVRTSGTDDLEDLIDSYRSRTFGFASTNFFAELLAAVEVERNAERYFGKVERQPPIQYVEAKIPDFIDIDTLSDFLKLDTETLKELNPGLTDAVFNGTRRIPEGTLLRLPYDGKLEKDAVVRLFFAGYSQIPGVYKFRTQLKGGELVAKKRNRSRLKRAPGKNDSSLNLRHLRGHQRCSWSA